MFQLPALQHAQQFRLRRQAQQRNFIEEQGSTVRRFEPAGSRFGNAGIGALVDAEKFRFHQLLRYRCTIDLYKWLVGATALAVHFARKHAFAHAAFPKQQHGGAGRRDPVNAMNDAEESGRGADCHRA
jgi:hypothetical protein